MGGHALGHLFEAPVGTEGVPLPGEHAGRVFPFPFKGKHPGGIGKGPGQIFLQEKAQQFPLIFKGGQDHLGNGSPGEGMGHQPGAHFLAPHGAHIVLPPVGPNRFRPLVQQAAGTRPQGPLLFRQQGIPLGQVGLGLARHLGEEGFGRAQGLALPGKANLVVHLPVVTPQGVRNFRQVAGPLHRHNGPPLGGFLHRDPGQFTFLEHQASLRQFGQQGLIEGGDPVVVKAGGHGTEDGHGFRRLGEQLPVALILFAYIPQGILRPLPVEFVDGDEIGKIQHVDFFQLGRGAKLGGHDIEGSIHQGHDGPVPLTNARGFHNNQVKAGKPTGGNHLGQGGGYFRARFPGGQGAHENVGMGDGIHANPIPQQGAPRALAGGVDGNNGDPEIVLLVQTEAAYQFVSEGGFTRPPGTRNPQGGGVGHPGRLGEQALAQGIRIGAVFQGGNDPGQLAPVPGGQGG